MMAKLHIATSVKGEAVEFLCNPGDTLLSVLRNELQLTGTKEGCSSGDCGACSITLDQRLVCSCLVLAAEVQNSEIGTIEGVADKDKLHIIQQKFLQHAALQCGICTPGLVVSTQAMLKEMPNPTEAQARLYLAGNLCRCTGYDKIIRAVMDAAETMRGSDSSSDSDNSSSNNTTSSAGGV
ncbi:MAG: carbon-monoxide dehydrogenase small subunit [Paraglaciecola psychrophila]|jgi:carbon-monoxide dehydrogenase small subunit